jgi:hypothetical protein
MDNVAEFNRAGFIEVTLAEKMMERMYDNEVREELIE